MGIISGYQMLVNFSRFVMVWLTFLLNSLYVRHIFREVCLQVRCVSLSLKTFWLPDVFSVYLMFKLSRKLVLRDRN